MHRTAMRVPFSQENLSGKDLDEESEENWSSTKAKSGHEGEEHPVVGQAVYGTYSIQEGVGCRMPEWY